MILKKASSILSKSKLCFSCTGTKDWASDCLSNRSCVKCNGKYFSSICEKATTTLLTTRTYSVSYPWVLIEIEEVKCHALINTGAGALREKSPNMAGFFGLYFAIFNPIMGKYRLEKTLYFDTFHAMEPLMLQVL